MRAASLVAAAGAFGLVVALAPAVRALCIRRELYDRPGPLKIHAKPVPRLGGIAVTTAILGGTLASTRFSLAHTWSLLVAVALVFVVGVVDDVRGLSAAIRLVTQIAAGAILWCGSARLMIPTGGPASLAATCLLTVMFANALNFIDGADGIASGVAGIIAIYWAIFPWPPRDFIAPAVAWALAGSCAGFLIFNFPAPAANPFLGDGGSTVLGLCMAFLAMHFYGVPAARGPLLLFPLLLAGLPLLDMALAVVRRALRHASPLFGDRSHFYDLLAARGYSARVTALICYTITVAFGCVSYAGMRIKTAPFLGLAGLCVGAFLVAAIRLGGLKLDKKGERASTQVLSETGRKLSIRYRS